MNQCDQWPDQFGQCSETMSASSMTFVVPSTTMPYRYISPAVKEQIIIMAACMNTKKIAEVTGVSK